MQKRGFTLIELSIVLIIAGLLIAGVLVGRDLIRAAEIRGTIGQMEKFTAAANAFRLKYGALPGDVQPVTAGQLGFFQLTGTCTGACINRFGNNLIDSSSDGGSNYIEEQLVFWRHLSEANLIDVTFASDPSNPINPVNGAPTSLAGNAWYALFYPGAKLSGNYFFHATHFVRANLSDGVMMPAKSTDYIVGASPALRLSPLLSYAIDTKIDDGKPNTGKAVDVSSSLYGGWDGTNGPFYCTFGGATAYDVNNEYNINPASDSGNQNICQFAVSAGF